MGRAVAYQGWSTKLIRKNCPTDKVITGSSVGASLVGAQTAQARGLPPPQPPTTHQTKSGEALLLRSVALQGFHDFGMTILGRDHQCSLAGIIFGIDASALSDEQFWSCSVFKQRYKLEIHGIEQPLVGELKLRYRSQGHERECGKWRFQSAS